MAWDCFWLEAGNKEKMLLPLLFKAPDLESTPDRV